jgi:hypothetical protein
MSTPVVLSIVVGKPGPVRPPGEKTQRNVLSFADVSAMA